ncbi:glycoside hydrolase family 15 protein [Acidobacterium sp. S8]|uniref:glycoside hydrolase family 15 protein n=1 Tax=Acidobacterium sp. S8 TaxID=1641854 RepID=UPI00131EB1FA|nr:glycoside hydrolase family 15 protein [Acidobacterium sp. S8]
MALAIEDYALIGDCETAALVGKNGSIDWLCWPDFSSPACFAALIGTDQNGRWLLAPKDSCKRITRRYREHTLILETRFETASGTLLVTDFMPLRETHSDIVRIAKCLAGKVTVQMELCVRFDYGRTIPWTGARERNAWAAAAGTGVAYLRTQQPIRTKNEIASAEFKLTQGEYRSFVLTHARAQESPPRRINVRKALQQTERFWSEWCGLNTYEGEWREAVERSLITLKALTYRPTGGIVAAPTTSLPERIGGDRNWDYRYCWLRDAAFTLETLLSVGYHDEARAWQDWLLQAVGSNARDLQIMYGMRGERHLPELELPWLQGYRKSQPVRMGNDASEQLQLDVYGEISDAIISMKRAGIRLDQRIFRLQRDLMEYVASIWHLPASGLWEQRNQKKHYIYSKAMAWLTLHHGVEITNEKKSKEWKVASERLHRQICRRGFNRKLGSFVQAFDANVLDASVLLLPISGFLPFNDERVKSTMDVIQKKLSKDGFIYRLSPNSRKGRESAFIACSFWMVQNLSGAGRWGDAERLFEKLISLRNDVGLLSEEYDPDHGRFMGNFPQALSHIALINAARMLTAH